MNLPVNTPPLPLSRNTFGRLVLQLDDGRHAVVTPVRAFPLTAPLEGLSLVGENGKEQHWIAHLDQVDAAARALLDEDLAVREFVPQILRIVSVSSYAMPSLWELETDRGTARMTLKAEEDIRKLDGRRNLLIAAADGVNYKIPDTTRLDKPSRKMLERFL
ncbi:DUF1854 domain-containing protein [Comamonas humi]